MHRLNTFAYDMGSKAKVAMNGFTWFGPPGVIALTPGFSLGYVKSGYHLDPTSSTSEWLSIGINRQQGGGSSLKGVLVALAMGISLL